MPRWLIQRDVIVVPKSVKKERMKQNRSFWFCSYWWIYVKSCYAKYEKKSTIHDPQDLETARWIATSYKMEEQINMNS